MGAALKPTYRVQLTTASAIPFSRVEAALAARPSKAPDDIGKLVDAMREDPIFRLAVQVIKGKIQGARVAFDTKAPEDLKARAKALEETLQRSWERSLGKAVEAVEYGRQAFEVIHRWEPGLNAVVVDRLVPIPYGISQPIYDPSGFSGVRCRVGEADFVISRNSLWWFGLDAEPGNPHGRSRYLGGPAKVMMRRKLLDRHEDAYDDRFAIGNAIARYPTDMSYVQSLFGRGSVGETGTDSRSIDCGEIMASKLEEMRAGGVLLLPSDKLPTEKGGGFAWDYDAVGQEFKSVDPLVQRRTYLDVAALRSMGLPERAVIQEAGSGGSYNLAEIHNITADLMVQEILSQAVDSFQADVVRPGVEANGLPDGSITATYQSLTNKTTEHLVGAILRLLEAPAVPPMILSGIVDVVSILEQSGIPLGPGADDVYGSLRAAIAAVTPAPVPGVV